MKKIHMLFCLGVLFLLVAGCGESADSVATSVEDQISVEVTEEAADIAVEEQAEAGEEAIVEATTDDNVDEVEDEVMETTAEMAEASENNEYNAYDVAGCTDTDGGLNYNEAGSTVDVHGVTDADYCSENKNYSGRLYENYCEEDGKHGRETYDCPSGSCKDGACIPE